MSVFKLYDCDIGITLNETRYDFTHVDSVQIEDPERTRLIRGANAGNTTGIAYVEGIKEAKTITIPVIGIPSALHNALKKAYKEKTRMEVFCVSRSDGSAKLAKKSILTQSPKQLTVDDSAESMAMSLVWESFEVEETHKEAGDL